MIKRLLILILAVACCSTSFAQNIQSPEQFLGYKLGEQFTPHHRIVEYFKYVAGASKNVKLQQFGTTNEGRPQLAMFIASDENIGRLEEIRHNNLKLAGMESGAANLANTPVILWLSYNVHGNEPASSETSMWTLYDLVNPSNSQNKEWLKNMLVVIDPCLNPDGRDRYVNFYNSVKGQSPDPTPTAREHVEPWPGGRVNHYYFDLNRDWAWQAQKETQNRVALYNQWLPEVHVDYHEQGYNAPYYFAPAAEPYHKDLTQWQRDFQVTIGRHNAKDFDKNGWMYFTKQIFDLLYPSYGDTYPLYNGAIGMTYEQGGIGAGLAVQTRIGDTLTLVQRVAHHHSTSISTIETTSANATKLLSEFKKFHDNGISNPPGQFKTYVIKNDNNEKTRKLAEMLSRNGIQFGYGLSAKSVTGFSYFTGKTETTAVDGNDLVINAAQAKAVLLDVLMEPKTDIVDSATYDITGWALPYAFGLKAYGLKETLKPSTTNWNVIKPQPLANTHAYAYVSAWQSVADVKFLAALLKKGIKVRYAEQAFETGGKKFMAGSLLIAKASNNRADFDQVVTSTANEMEHELTPLLTGFVDKGYDFGSNMVHALKQPRVMLIAGDGVNSEAMGEVWHLFEQQIGYPISLVRYQDLNRTKISDFDVAIFADGRYDNFPSEKLQSWVRDGGRLIAMENAVSLLADKKDFGIKRKEGKKDDKPAGAKADARVYANRERDAISSNIPGAVYKLNLDTTHPLAFGMPKTYFTIKNNDELYDYFTDDDSWNVGTLKADGYTSGFVGVDTKKKLTNGMLIGVQSMGRGTVVYLADDPLFRSFWENGKLLFSNAVFMVGQ
ncbi:M14 metallopeptidase family protein [Mucilaginibacter pedocola]|uniref:Zinc carboxypeptidase n=1 Tax=Mucilaginibacter pedocola TaxID=1792845 RepID=A0A1S9PHT1_9SPHI|nr:M14 metallopeptidase family protein [Mucilaginibacter pedocola]OOQ60516.1 zinc carboxypeptidase [Mucilaginibacter pedocola]